MNVLVIRFSSIGDVALTLPAVKGTLKANKDLTITFLSKSFFEPLFQNTYRLQFEGVDLTQYNGLFGLIRLCKFIEHKYPKFDAVIDLHDSLRSKIIRTYFFLRKAKISVIDKGRKQKKRLIRKEKKELKPLLHHTQRYANTFNSLRIDSPLETDFSKLIIPSENGMVESEKFLSTVEGKKLIGIAPFTTSPLKEWPFRKILDLASALLESDIAIRVLIFGGKSDLPKIQSLLQVDKNRILSAIGLEGGLATELAVIKKLDLMICMDSGNMHLATMLGTPVKVIFGPTHPFLGFSPYLLENAVIQDNKLPCRPCTVFGNTTCWRNDHACMENLNISVSDLHL
jgi:ADP-heptose:LPS heptosyltransferase